MVDVVAVVVFFRHEFHEDLSLKLIGLDEPEVHAHLVEGEALQDVHFGTFHIQRKEIYVAAAEDQLRWRQRRHI